MILLKKGLFMLRPFGFAQRRQAQHERGIVMFSISSPLALSPSTNQPFVLSLSKETAGWLRTDLSKPVVSLSNQVNGGFFRSLLRPFATGK